MRLSELGESWPVSYFFPRMNTLLRAISLRSSLENRAFYATWKNFCYFMKWIMSSSLKILDLALSIAFWFLLPLRRNDKQLSLNRTGLRSFIRSTMYFDGTSLIFVELLLSKMLVIRYFWRGLPDRKETMIIIILPIVNRASLRPPTSPRKSRGP